MFEKIVALINESPITFLPALLVAIIKRCIKEPVFNDINVAVAKIINGCTAENLETNPPQTTNSDYAAALRVISEWEDSRPKFRGINPLCHFIRTRLNPAKAPDCA